SFFSPPSWWGLFPRCYIQSIRCIEGSTARTSIFASVIQENSLPCSQIRNPLTQLHQLLTRIERVLHVLTQPLFHQVDDNALQRRTPRFSEESPIPAGRCQDQLTHLLLVGHVMRRSCSER